MQQNLSDFMCPNVQSYSGYSLYNFLWKSQYLVRWFRPGVDYREVIAPMGNSMKMNINDNCGGTPCLENELQNILTKVNHPIYEQLFWHITSKFWVWPKSGLIIMDCLPEQLREMEWFIIVKKTSPWLKISCTIDLFHCILQNKMTSY